MAGEIASAFVRIRPNMEGFRSETESGVRDAFKGIRKIVGGVFAATGVFEFGKSLVEAASEHQSQFAVLDKTLQNAGTSTKVMGQEIEALLEKEARLKGFSDESLAQAFIRIVSATKDSTKAFKDLQAAEDLSRARHIDLATAALALSKAEQGKTNSLQRYGIILPAVTAAEDALKKKRDEALAAGAKFTASDNQIYKAALDVAKAQDAQAKNTEALTVVTQRFGGSAGEFAKTASGQFQRLQQDIHQAEVAFGENLLPGLSSAAEAVGRFAVSLTHNQTALGGERSALHALGEAFGIVKEVVSAIGPTLLAVASAGARVVSAIGAPSLLAAAATYKALSISVALASTAQGFYARAVAASVGGTEAAAAVEKRKATATTETSVATAALTRTLSTNTAALVANADATAVVSREQLTLFSGYTAVAGAATAATAANVELAGSETAVAAAGGRAATGGLGSFLRGVGVLGAGKSGGPVGIAIGGLAVLAGAFVYLATRETEAQKKMKEFAAGLSALGSAAQSEPVDQLAVSQAALNLEVANNAVANSKAKPGTTEYTQLLLNQKEAVLSLTEAQRTLSNDRRTIVSSTKQEAEALAATASARQRDYDFQIKSLGGPYPQGSPGYAKAQALEVQAHSTNVKRLVDDLKKQADAEQAQSPILAHNLRLLAEYAASVKAIPTKKTISFFLDNTKLGIGLKGITAALRSGQPAIEKEGSDDGTLFAQAFLAPINRLFGTAFGVGSGVWLGISDGITNAAKAAEENAKHGVAAKKIASAAAIAIKNLRNGIASDQGALSDLKTQISEQVIQSAQAIQQAVNESKSNFAQIGSTIASDISQVMTAPLDRADAEIQAAGDRLSATFDQQSFKLQAQADVLNAAVSRISLAQQARAARFAGQNALIQNQENQLSLRQDNLNLEGLRKSVILPGGKQLSANPKEALSQLQSFAASARGASKNAIEQFAAQYQTAVLASEKDRITIATQTSPKSAERQAYLQLDSATNALKTQVINARHAAATARLQIRSDLIRIERDVATARARIAAKEVADVTDAFNRAPTAANLKKVTEKIAKLMAKDHVSFANAGDVLGSAFLHGFEAQFTGLLAQGKAQGGIAGKQGGLVPQVVTPLQTIVEQNRQSDSLTRQYRKTQLAEMKKQTTLLAKLHAEAAAKKFIDSIHKNPGQASKNAKDLAGTSG